MPPPPMNERYDFSTVESKWQARWEKDGLFRSGQRPTAPKKYVLEMLPYPSGKMHMGHVRNYLLGDVYARYYAMRGHDVIHPMGWDAFGLPAENAAIKEKVHPAVRTQENIVFFKQEMISLGYAYDWSKEINTSEPGYYRWNQWFFLKMLEKGLVYRRFSRVNWCTGCLTVIANEQVKDGNCERCDSKVIDKEMPEWAFRITRYSDALLEGLDHLKQWPERITSMQRNWIGRSEGVEAEFPLDGREGSIRIFSTRIDTVHGATYVVIAPGDRAVQLATPEERPRVQEFVEEMARLSKTERAGEMTEKRGVFTGAHAVNPFTHQRIPIWTANFVLAEYGTGAVMAVPAHDVRDFEFAKKYGLPIKIVLKRPTGETLAVPETVEQVFVDDGVLVDSGDYTGLSSAEARAKEGVFLELNGKGKRTVTYRQKDWGFSRQRYWGTPIPIVYCDRCDPKREGTPVPEWDLPVRLPEIETEQVLTGKGEPPLAKVPSFLHTTCPKCGGPATREVETMDTFVDSCWYYARYLSPQYDRAPFDPAEARRWLPVDIYVGGPEHAVMHLLYFRFWSRVMKELGLSPTDEPVTRLVTQGIVNGPDGRKMSKRWGNVVTPAVIVKRYGADTARTYVLFAGPPERDFDWSDEQVEGAHRFLKRVWTLAYHHRAACAAAGDPETVPAERFTGRSLEMRRAAHKCVKRVGEAIERLSFNTAIAGIMELVNALYAFEAPKTPEEEVAMGEAVRLLAAVLTPFAPHVSDEIGEAYGATGSTVREGWPDYDPALVVDDVLPYAVQVNGKLRGEIKVPAHAAEDEVRAAAESDDKVKTALSGKTVRKVVFVPKRLINFVVS
ncbi:MAG TPA: leucine--tRNA ligase [Myxococcaceae bacterium]